MNGTISELNEKNLPDIVKLEKICFSSPWSEESLLSAARNGTRFYVYGENGITKGYLGVSVILDEGYITNVAVFPKYRKNGIATFLLQSLIENAEKQKLQFLSLEVRESNKPAISLYNKLGFTPCGRRKNFYINPTEDALILTRRF